MQRLVIAIVLSLAASVATAADYSDLYIVPVAGHARGAFGTAWRSDLVLHNFQAAAITVDVAFVESGRAPSAEAIAIVSALQLGPRETRVLADVLSSLDRDVIGALIVAADRPFAVTSRTWAALPAGRTLGQSVQPIAIGDGADTTSDVAVLAALPSTAGQRANVGLFVAALTAPVVVEVATVNASGATTGTRRVVLSEPGFVHQQFAAAAGAAAIVRIVSGDALVVPYASVVDNVSAEAMFVEAPPIGAQADAARSILGAAARTARNQQQ